MEPRTLRILAAGFALLAVVAVVLAFAVASGTATWLLVSTAVALLTAAAGLWQQSRATHPS